MKKIWYIIKKFYKENDKKSLITFVLLRVLIIFCLIRELMHGNIENAMLCVLSLFLFIMPYILEKTFKIDFPSSLERIIFIFIFSAEILGEINNFYGLIPLWDTILHTVNGFLCGSLGFSLIYILNKNKVLSLSPFFAALVSFCFSMMVGCCWEMFEYAGDVILKTDMQKDEYVSVINTVELDPKKENNVVKVDDISYTIVYDKDGNELVKLNKYLDIGLHDTMKDLIVNFIGAVVFSIFGYLYVVNEEKYKFAGKLMTKSRSN